jgi:hypothetical protein
MFKITLASVLILFSVAWIRILLLRHQMERTADRYKRNGIKPKTYAELAR